MSYVSKIAMEPSRIKREWKTIDIMIRFYCRKNHNDKNWLCPDCKELHDYAYQRLLYCPYEGKKPVCSNCTVHCYRRDMRERVRKIMRYSGPRMIIRHPYLAIMHLINEKLKN